MARIKTPVGRKAKKVPRKALATCGRAALVTRRSVTHGGRSSRSNPQSPPNSSAMQPETGVAQVATQLATRSSTRERRVPTLLGNYEVSDGRRLVNGPSSATSVPPPQRARIMTALSHDQPGVNVNDTNPPVANGDESANNGGAAGDEAANNGGAAVDDIANNDNGDEGDLDESSASGSDSSDDPQDSEEDEDDVEEAGR